MVNETRTCLHCGEQLLGRYRADRKFCAEKYGTQNFCKNAYHKPKALEKYHLTKEFNAQFIVCREILRKTLGDLPYQVVYESQLLDAGWSFGYGLPGMSKSTGNKSFSFGGYIAEVIDQEKIKIYKDGK